MAAEKLEFTFLWFIKNYSYCLQDIGERLVSAKITPHGLDGTSWNLRVYPRGVSSDNREVSFYPGRSEHDAGPDKFELEYELSIIAPNGSPLKSFVGICLFEKGIGRGKQDFLSLDKDLLRRKAEYVAQDVLRLRCRMWCGEGRIRKAGQYSARTYIGTENISFRHKVEHFSSLKPNQKNNLLMPSHFNLECTISSSLYFIDNPCCEGKLIVEIGSDCSSYTLRKRKVSVLNGSNEVIKCEKVDNRFDATIKDIKRLPLSLTREIILDERVEYLSNDELSLICECTFSTGITFEEIEESQCELPAVASNESCSKDGYNLAKKLSACTSALEDIKALYIDQCLTDVVFKTKTKTFPAHKIVISARSSVLKAMFTNDMKEKKTDCIQVDDLEDDTLQQLLLFFYSDNLENLRYESALQLYYAADKYAVEKLKLFCSNFLVEKLSPSNAVELLLLADRHNDSDFKNFVEDFILKHKEQIVDLDEWKNLQQKHPHLVIGLMHLMIKGVNEVNRT